MVPLTHEDRRTGPGAGAAPLALVGGLLAMALAVLFLPLWAACWREWWREGSAYSHGILIPPLALFMLWHRREGWARLEAQPSAGALALLIPALALQLFARWAHSTMVSWAAFVLICVAGIAFWGGWRAARRLLPIILFLTFMVPMSAMLTQPIVFGAQRASTLIAAAILKLTGFQAQQVGTVIQMENYTFQVGLPCSGFKTLIALAAFACCFVYLLEAPRSKKLTLLGAALVLAMLVNGLRISLVGITGELVSNEAATWVHDNGGLPVTALALGGLFLLARLMKCPFGLTNDQRPTTDDLTGGRSDGLAEANALPGGSHRPSAPSAVGRRPSVVGRRLSALVGLCGVSAVVATRMPTVQTEARENAIPARRLPLQMGQWKGTEQTVPADVQRALPTAQILSRRYDCPAGSAEVTIVAGSDATALHDPHDCLTGDGWEFLEERSRSVDVGRPTGPITVRDVVMTKEKVRARMWYWYAIGSDIYDRTLPARLALFKTRITEGEGRRAEFVRLIAGGETESARTDLMLADLVRRCTEK